MQIQSVVIYNTSQRALSTDLFKVTWKEKAQAFMGYLNRYEVNTKLKRLQGGLSNSGNGTKKKKKRETRSDFDLNSVSTKTTWLCYKYLNSMSWMTVLCMQPIIFYSFKNFSAEFFAFWRLFFCVSEKKKVFMLTVLSPFYSDKSVLHSCQQLLFIITLHPVCCVTMTTNNIT